MSNLIPIDEFSDVIQIETTDVIRGGTGGKANEQAQALTNRTTYLNNKITEEVSRIDDKDDSQDEDIEGLDTRLTSVETEITNARGGKTNLDTRLDDIESVNSTQNTNISNLQTEVTNARSGKTNLKTRIDEIATSVTNLSNGQVTTNKNNIASHTTQINNINTQITNANNVLSKSTLKATVEEIIARINTKQASGSYVLTSNIVTNYTTNNTSKVLAANVGVLLKSLIDGKQASGNYVTWSQVANAISNDSSKVARADTVYQVWQRMPAGAIIPFAGNTIPSGFLLCDGSYVSRTTYSALYSAIGTIYGSSSSSNFRLPILNDGRFIEGSASSGTYRNAGLPNITGKFPNGNETNVYIPTGAFYKHATEITTCGYDGTGYPNVICMDASRSNSIYGASTTVQPKSVTVKYIIKY